MLTRQEIFDRVADHLLRQNAQSRQEAESCYGTPTMHCMYRAGGLKCGVGCLIRDEDYSPIMEGASAAGLDPGKTALSAQPGTQVLRAALINAGIDVDQDWLLLRRLQMVHDNFGTWEWPEMLATVGREEGLSTRVIDERQV